MPKTRSNSIANIKSFKQNDCNGWLSYLQQTESVNLHVTLGMLASKVNIERNSLIVLRQARQWE